MVTNKMCPKHKKIMKDKNLLGYTVQECEDSHKEMLESFKPPTKKELAVEQKSARHNQGKVQMRELDPDFLIGIGEVLTASRQKYDEGNWMKETKFTTPYESCMRHLMKFWNGEELDDETQKHHLLHAATNLMFLYYHQTSGKGIDDRLFKKEKK